MKQNNVVIIIDIIVYIFQIILMITFSNYTHNNSLYLYFFFSLFYNLLLSFSLIDTKRYSIKIIILNIFFGITVYFFGNKYLLQKREITDIISSICFNVLVLFFFAGNWLIAFMINRLVKKRT